MNLAHRQVVRGAPLDIGRAQLLASQPARCAGEGVAGQRGARRVRGRAGGGPVANFLFLELEPMADVVDVPGIPPIPKVVLSPPVPYGPVPTSYDDHESVWPCV